MSNPFYQDDEFEQFLQDEVKQHRMYPSDHIWKNIRTELHGYKAWPALTFISLFIITALTISTVLNNHPDKHVLVPVNAAHTSAAVSSEATDNGETVTNDYFQKITPEQLTAETFADKKEETVVPQETLVVRNTTNDNTAVPVKSVSYNSERNDKPAAGRSITETVYAEPVNAALQNTSILPVAAEGIPENLAAPEDDNMNATSGDLKKTNAHSSADDFLKDFNFVTSTPRAHTSKFGYQFYITPSNSYRKLSDQKVKDIIQPAIAATNAQSSVPLSNSSSADINSVVRHRPAMGFELGFSVLYNMSGRLKFKTGLQLNIRQYYIETYQSSTNDLASLSLINYRGIETISFYSPYNNNTGFRQTQLDNRIYQLSVPIGIQWDVLKGKHLGINTEASVQPTFTLNSNSYLLSTDYKHYTTGNDFIRKWNINTSVGFNVTYTSGSSSWQIGPQVRYQHLPTYSNLYPIREFLMDYGIRLGFTHQLK